MHQGERAAYGAPFGEGDVVGLLLHMPRGGRAMEAGEDQVVRYKGSLYVKPVRGAPSRGRGRGACRGARRCECAGAFEVALPGARVDDRPRPRARAQDDKPPEPLRGSGVAFAKNGQLQGVAFADVNEGTYYPAASLFTRHSQGEGATVMFNFGPDFKHAPPRVEGWPEARPVSELAGAPPAAAPAEGAAPPPATAEGAGGDSGDAAPPAPSA